MEVGIGELSWADTEPVDAGTRRVVLDGFLPLADPAGLLARLVDSVAPK